MASIYGDNLDIDDISYDEAVKRFRDEIRSHIQKNKKYYKNNVPASLSNYFDSRHKEGSMDKQLEEIERLTYGLHSLLDLEDPDECSKKSLEIVKESIQYEDGIVGIFISKINNKWVRFTYWSYNLGIKSSIQAFNFFKPGLIMAHYDVTLNETNQGKKTKEIEYSINLID